MFLWEVGGNKSLAQLYLRDVSHPGYVSMNSSLAGNKPDLCVLWLSDVSHPCCLLSQSLP